MPGRSPLNPASNDFEANQAPLNNNNNNNNNSINSPNSSFIVAQGGSVLVAQNPNSHPALNSLAGAQSPTRMAGPASADSLWKLGSNANNESARSPKDSPGANHNQSNNNNGGNSPPSPMEGED
jgi:hypothetical protein